MLASVFVLAQHGLALTQLPQLLTDKPYREQLLKTVTDRQVIEFFHRRFDRWGRETPLMIESTLRRVFLLTFSPALRYTLGQQDNTLNFRRLMDEGVSVIFNLGGLDEEVQRFLGCLLTVGFEVAALSRADVPEAQRRPYQLILDEFSMFSAQSEQALARVLSLARKYGLFLTMSHQTWSQVSQRLAGALQNTVDIAFRLGRDDAERTAPLFAHFDPYRVKHEVEDQNQVDRTHPVYFGLQETWEEWAQTLQHLRPREAVVQVSGKTRRIRTLDVPKPQHPREAVQHITDRYAHLFLRPADDVRREVDGEPEPVPPTVRRVVVFSGTEDQS